MKFDELTNFKSEIFKVELAAWLHNLGKFSPKFVTGGRDPAFFWCGWLLQFDRDRAKKGPSYVRNGSLGQSLLAGNVSLPSPFKDYPTYCLASLVELVLAKGAYSDTVPFGNLNAVIARAHGEASGQEKRSWQKEATLTDRNYADKDFDPKLAGQLKTLPRWSVSPFGYAEPAYTSESCVWAKQDSAVQEANKQLQAAGGPLFDCLKALLTPGLADSQLPICDVRISDMGLMAAAFAKAAVVESLLTGVWRDKAQEWRLLRIAVEGLGYLTASTRIPDVLARQRKLEASLRALRGRIEQEILCGTEVYRDEYGPVFVIPAFASRNANAEFDGWLDSGLEQAWRSTPAGEELGYDLQRSPPFGLGSGRGYAYQLGKLLWREPPPASPRPSVIARAWEGIADGHQSEPCGACNIRPVAPDIKPRINHHNEPQANAHARRLCLDCYEGRTKRVEEWTRKPKSTIWLEEVADQNGRLVLIAARFRAEKWLAQVDDKPSYLEDTVFLERPSGPRKAWRNIAPSAARTRRLFETLDEFWKLVQEKWRLALMSGGPRIQLIPQAVNPEWKRHNAYELEAQNGQLRLSSVWTGTAFVLVENCEPMREQLGQQTYTVRIPAGYRRDTVQPRGLERGTFQMPQVLDWEVRFARTIEILHDPRQFLALVPAADAMACVESLQALYEERFGRVRNRLAMDVTLIAADADTPLRALLDAGRRGLARQPAPEIWTVHCCTRTMDAAAVRFHNRVAWRIPLNWPFPVEINGTTISPAPDDYFPYFHNRKREPVHASDLQPGDRVYVEPSTLDYEFLDSASRRFEMSYDASGKRRAPDRLHRPMLLDHVAELQELWGLLQSRFAVRQMKVLDGLLAAKRQEWGDLPEAFASNVLHNLELKPDTDPLSDRDMIKLETAIQSGLLHDCLEWHLGVRKSHRDRSIEEDEEE